MLVEDAVAAEKIKPLKVTLDTNVFDGANYSYDSSFYIDELDIDFK